MAKGQSKKKRKEIRVGEKFPISLRYLVTDRSLRHMANTDMLFAPKELFDPATFYAKFPLIITFLLSSLTKKFPMNS